MTKRGRGQRRNRRLKNRSRPFRWIHSNALAFSYIQRIHSMLSRLLGVAMGLA